MRGADGFAEAFVCGRINVSEVNSLIDRVKGWSENFG